jgi:hypothetical protein
MNRFKFAVLAAALLLHPLVHAGSAASGSLHTAHHTVSRVEARWDNSLILDDVQSQECDPEDDCPRPSLPRQ